MANLKVRPIKGWLLIARDVEAGANDWHIAWPWEVFNTKRKALSFASDNGWQKPYRAVHGHLAATPKQPG